MYDVPVAFICFKRLETAKKVFSRIREIQPKQLFIIADGPRNEEEAIKVNNVREYIESQIDWDCEVTKNYAEKNLGCKNRINTGLDWLFTKVDEAVILEDDVYPNLSFFQYCKELLEYYRDDERIMIIDGYNNCGDIDINDSYLFYDKPSIWGWATWKRAWNRNDKSMKDWPALKKSGYMTKNFLKNTAYNLIRDFDRAYYGEVDTWDFTWEYSIINNKGMSIIPRVNLVENIGGNDIDATHTDGDVTNYEVKEMTFPLVHPSEVKLDMEYKNRIEMVWEEHLKVNILKEYVKSRLPRSIANIFRNVN